MFDENGKSGYGQDYPDASHAKRDDGKNRVPPHVLKKEGKIEVEGIEEIEDISGQWQINYYKLKEYTRTRSGY